MTRPRSSTTSQPAFDPAQVDVDALPDREVENLLFEEEPDGSSGFWSLPTLTGLSIIGVGIAYLMEQMNVPLLDGFNLTFLVELLPILAGMIIILVGFGVLSERPSKKRKKAMKSREASSYTDTNEDDSSESSGFFNTDFLKIGEGRITRSRNNRKIAGVCGGLGEYLDVDPTLLRIGFVIGLVATGGNFLLAYLVLSFVIPKEDDNPEPQHVTIVRDR